MLYLKASGIWLVLLASAVIAGGVRQKWLEPLWGKLTAHQVGTLAVMVLMFGLVYLLLPLLGPLDGEMYWRIGLFWLVLTLLFEFPFGHYVLGNPWRELWENYHLHKGRLWPLILVNTLLAPYLVARLRGLIPPTQ